MNKPKERKITINFDPAKAGRTVQRIFRYKACRSLWLLWKQTHLCSTDFDDDVLDIGIRIGRLDTPIANHQKAVACFFPNRGDFLKEDVERFVTENIKYFDDTKLDFELVTYEMAVTTEICQKTTVLIDTDSEDLAVSHLTERDLT